MRILGLLTLVLVLVAFRSSQTGWETYSPVQFMGSTPITICESYRRLSSDEHQPAQLERASVIAFKPDGSILWRTQLSEHLPSQQMGLRKWVASEYGCMLQWENRYKSGRSDSLIFLQLVDTAGSITFPLITLNKHTDFPGEEVGGFGWDLEHFRLLPNNRAQLLFHLSNTAIVPLNSRRGRDRDLYFLVDLNQNGQMVAYSDTCQVLKFTQDPNWYYLSSFVFDSASRCFSYALTRLGESPQPPVREPLPIINASHTVAPPCFRCSPSMVRTTIPTLSGNANPNPGQMRAGEGLLANPGSEYKFETWFKPRIFYAGPDRHILMTAGNSRSVQNQAKVSALVFSGTHLFQYKWRTIIYVPFAAAISEQTESIVLPNGNVRFCINAHILPLNSTRQNCVGFLTFDLLPSGQLASAPQWRPGMMIPDDFAVLWLHTCKPWPGGQLSSTIKGQLNFYRSDTSFRPVVIGR